MSQMWILRPAEGDEPVFRVARRAIKTVGRASRADFVLDVALVSRLHCRLEANGDTLEVIDLSSTNGTFVNGRRVTRAPLSPGDRLRIGRFEMMIGKTRQS